jgi:hypothetical protein
VPGFFADFTKLAGGGWHIPIGSTGREMVLDFDSNIFGVRVEAKLGIFDLFDISHDFDFTFELPGISLDSLGLDLPTFEMPDLSGLKFKLPSIATLKFKLPSIAPTSALTHTKRSRAADAFNIATGA